MTVNYAPGAVDAIHQHDAHAVVYVLYGKVEMQVPGDDRSWSDQAQSSNPGAHAERRFCRRQPERSQPLAYEFRIAFVAC